MLLEGKHSKYATLLTNFYSDPSSWTVYGGLDWPARYTMLLDCDVNVHGALS